MAVSLKRSSGFCEWIDHREGVATHPDGSVGAGGQAGQVYRISPRGRVSVLIEDSEAHTLSNPTNIAFGGPAFKDLFTSNLGRRHVTRIDLRVRAMPLASHLQETATA